MIDLLRPDDDQPTKDDPAELRTDMAELRVLFTNDIAAAFAAQKRTLVPALVIAWVLIALSNALAVVAG